MLTLLILKPMNKIYKKALENTELKTEDVLKLIEALEPSQQEVAMHIILGEYEAPTINEYSTKVGSRYANAHALSYNPLTDEVRFEYNSAEIITGWIPVELTQKNVEITVESFVSKKYWQEDAMPDINFEGTRQDFNKLFIRHDVIGSVESSKSQSTSSLSNWQ